MKSIPKKSPGDFLKAEEVNTLVEAAFKSRSMGDGFVDGTGDAGANKEKSVVRWFQVENDDDEDIEPFSIFSIVGTPEFDYDEPIKVNARKVGVDSLSGGHHCLYLTNGAVGIPSGATGWAKPINDFEPVRILIAGEETPTIGGFCGPTLDTFGVDGSRYGMICLGVDGNYAICIKTSEPGSFVGVVTEEITAYDSELDALGSGKMAVYFRDDTPVGSDSGEQFLFDLINARDPETSGSTWVQDVWNIDNEPISVGSHIVAHYCTGVGLVVGAGVGVGSGSDGDDGGSKDTAIVPASWVSTGYTALFVVEDPCVRFADILIIDTQTKNQLAIIDPKLLEVVHPETLEICGCTSNLSARPGVRVEDGCVRLTFPWWQRLWKRDTHIVLQFTAIRKGFKGVRFPKKTRDDFEANERWLKRGG